MEKLDEEVDKTNQDDNSEATAKDLESKREDPRKGEEEDIDNKDSENTSTKSATIIYVGQQTEVKKRFRQTCFISDDYKIYVGRQQTS